MNITHDKYIIENKIKSLSKIYDESNETILHLNGLVSQYITARDNETRKKENLQKSIAKLNAKLDRLEELEPSSDK